MPTTIDRGGVWPKRRQVSPSTNPRACSSDHPCCSANTFHLSSDNSFISPSTFPPADTASSRPDCRSHPTAESWPGSDEDEKTVLISSTTICAFRHGKAAYSLCMTIVREPRL